FALEVSPRIDPREARAAVQAARVLRHPRPMPIGSFEAPEPIPSTVPNHVSRHVELEPRVEPNPIARPGAYGVPDHLGTGGVRRFRVDGKSVTESSDLVVPHGDVIPVRHHASRGTVLDRIVGSHGFVAGNSNSEDIIPE